MKTVQDFTVFICIMIFMLILLNKDAHISKVNQLKNAWYTT